MVGDNKESLKGKGVFFGASVGGWWFFGGGLGVACFLFFLRGRFGGGSKGACLGVGVWLCPFDTRFALLREGLRGACWVWGWFGRAGLGFGCGVEACFLPSLSSRLGGVSKGRTGDRCLALPLRYALSRYSGRTRRGLEVGVRGFEFGFAGFGWS